MNVQIWNPTTRQWEPQNIPLIVPVRVGNEYRDAALGSLLASLSGGGGGGGGGTGRVGVLRDGASVVPKARFLNFSDDFDVTSAGNGDQADITLASSRRLVTATAYFVDCTAAGGDNEVNVPFPVDGRLVSVSASATFAPDEDMVFTCSIGGNPVTNGALTIAAAAVAGSVSSALPTGNNAGTVGTTSVQIVLTLLNTEPGHVTIVLGFEPA